MENSKNKTIKSFQDLIIYQNLYNEIIHHLSVCVDVYKEYVDVGLVKEIIDLYDVSCKQLTKLGQSWQDYHKNR